MCCRHLAKKKFVCKLSEFNPPTSCGIWRVLPRSFLDDLESDIDVCNVYNVNCDHGDPVIVHLHCLRYFLLLRYLHFAGPICSHFVDRITVRTSFGLFILWYFINMHYGHIASDNGASICERTVLSFII